MEIIIQAIYKSVLRLGQRWGELGLLEYVDTMVCFSWIGLADSCCLWMQNSLWVLKLYEQKGARA